MNVGIVINPIAGRRGSRSGEADRRRAFAQSHADAAGVSATVVLTEGRGHARELARDFVDAKCDTVIAMGGDGTVNEVARALVGTSTSLGILPCGSGDGFATGLGLTANLEKAMHTALTAAPVAVDVGYAGDRLFLNLAGIGFDASVAHRFDGRSRRGVVGYASAGFGLLWAYNAPDYDVSWDTGVSHEQRQGPRFLLGFSNSSAYGNGAILAPDARLRDGLLDLVLVSAGGRNRFAANVRQVWRARRLFWNHRRPAEGIERARVVSATVRGESLVCHVDGEAFEVSGSLEIRVRPQALLVRPGRTL